MRTLYIINPISGKGKKQRIARILEAKGCKIAFTEYAGHADTVENNRCDQLAVAAANGTTLLEDTGYQPE